MRELDEALEDWERYQSIPLEDLLKERDLRNMVLHALLVSTQAAIDIANHFFTGCLMIVFIFSGAALRGSLR
jgi:uncharacterized protein YutE (UPF0331/DUF86 family)